MTESEESLPELLWHYTDTEGLKGIVQAGSIWATDAEYLNDASELRFGREELMEALRQEAAHHRAIDSDSPRGITAGSTLRYIEMADDLQEARTSGVYVACFCEDGDLLSQWRGYASGSGFALGFRTDLLSEVSVKPPTGYPESRGGAGGAELVPVSYGMDTVPTIVKAIVNDVVSASPNHPGTVGYHYGHGVIPRRLAEHKHQAFAEEREWRVISALPDTDWQPVHFRSGRLGLIPFVELRLPPLALQEVRIGPGPNEALRRKAVRRLLEVHRAQAVVSGSAAPFRP